MTANPTTSKSTATTPGPTTATSTTYANTIIIGGGKGGVGKSICTLSLLYLFERAGKKVQLIEADTSNPDVHKAYGDVSSPQDDAAPLRMSTLDLEREDAWLDLLNMRAADPTRTIVLNTRAALNLAIEEFGPLLNVGLKELGAPLVTIWPIDGNRDCLELLAQYRETFSTGQFVVLRNAHLSQSFELYDSSKLRREIEGAGGRSETLPALAPRVAQALNINRLSLTAAEHSDKLQFGHKIALRAWLKSVTTVLGEVTT
jgi:hypothetical protein